MKLLKYFDKLNKEKNVIIYGRHAAIEALKNKNRKIKRVLLADNYKDLERLILDILKNIKYKIIIEKVDKKNIEAFLGKNIKHQGIVVISSKIPIVSYKKIFDYKSFRYGVLLDRLTDPNNVGAIYRSAYSFDIDFIVNLDKGALVESGALLNSSCGCYEKINTYITKNLVASIKEFKKNNWWIVGTDEKAELSTNKFLRTQNKNDKTLIILGSEGDGIKRLTKKNCDFLVKIQTKEGSSSLNVSNAAAILFYELHKNFREVR